MIANLIGCFDEGKIGQALDALDNDAARLTQVIQGYLGLRSVNR